MKEVVQEGPHVPQMPEDAHNPKLLQMLPDKAAKDLSCCSNSLWYRFNDLALLTPRI